MSDEVLSPDEQLIRYMGEEMDEIRVGRAKAYFQIRRLRTQLAERDRRIAELETELRRWRGCPSCKEDHDDNVMCPPHEVRTSGRAWFHTQARKWAERAEEAEFERDNLRDTCIDYEAKIDGLVAERDTWQETARQAYRNVDYYRGLVVSIGELFGQEARTSDDGSIQDDVLCAKVPELCTAMRDERDQLAAEVVRLREVLEMIATIKLNESDPNFIGICPMRIGFLRPVHMSKVKEILAATPHAAKAAERMRLLEEAVQAGRDYRDWVEVGCPDVGRDVLTPEQHFEFALDVLDATEEGQG